jgi:peptidyl-prolyl cis-trans isomerase C
LALTVLVLAAAADVRAQNPPAAAATDAGKAAVLKPTHPAQVLATVNNDKITKGELLNLIERYNIPPGDEQQVYRDGMDTLVNVKLINQYLARQNLPVSEKKIDADLDQLKKELQTDGQDLPNALARSGLTMDDVRNELANRQRWVDYVKLKGTDAELQRFVDNNKDLFEGTQIKASHILLKVDPKASPAEKEKVRQRLIQIKQDIERNKYTFAEAANKFSEDPSKTEGDGGDIGYFHRGTGILEEFADAAFKLKKGEISDPVETLHGYHLIQVTDRRPGVKFDLEAKKPFAMQMYAAELQKNILAAARKNAKIDIKPMPSDLVLHPQGPAAATAPGSTTGTTTKGAAPKP